MIALAVVICAALSSDREWSAAGMPDAMPAADAGPPDASDGLPPLPAARGCSCQGGADPGGLALGALAAALLGRRRWRVRT